MAFIKRFVGHTLVGKSIWLKSASAVNWPVKVEEHSERIYFERGWENFVDAHGLEVGNFVVFKFHYDSKFTAKNLITTTARSQSTKPRIITVSG